MKLTKFRIQNYKSITDSGYCTFASDLTILVGKNESGKTAILEALRYFNKSVLRVPEDALPLDGSVNEPLIEVCFQLNGEEVNEIQDASGVKLADGAIDYITDKGLVVTKDGRGRYSLSEECIGQLFSDNTSKEPIKHIQVL